MKQARVWSMLIIAISILTSCELSFGNSGTSSNSATSSTTSSSISTSEGVHTEPDPAYDDLFAPSSKVAINLTISSANLQLLESYGNSNDERTEIYLPAAIAISVNNGTNTVNYSFDQVGVRMKGNLSIGEFIDDGNYIYDLVHFKISFDEFVTNQRLLSMSKIDLKWNRNLDHTQIRQSYAYKMFKDYLYLSPDATLTKFGITQTSGSNQAYTYLGVYTLYEVIDKRLLKRVYSPSDAEGNLYKVTYNNKGPADFTMSGAVLKSGSSFSAINNGKIGIENAATDYVPSYDLKTNKQTPNFSDMATLIGRLNSTTNYHSDTSKAMLESLIDIDAYLKYEAVAYFMGNPDDLRNNYNNAYVYFVPSTGKAVFIPYDFDRSLGLNGNWDPTGNSMTQVRPFSNSAYGYGGDQTQRNPLYRYTITTGSHPVFQATYREHLLDILASDWLTEAKFNTMYHLYRANYEAEVEPDHNLPYVPFSLTEVTESNWKYVDYITAKRNITTSSL